MRHSSRLAFSVLAASTLLGSGYVNDRAQNGSARREEPRLPMQREAMLNQDSNQDEDPPTWVARLNYIQGPVSFRPGEVDDWAEATLNYPLRAGDHLWVDDGGSAELHVGSTALRLGPSTALTFLNFSDQLVQLQLTDGSAELRVRHLDGQRFEIATPQGAVTISHPGSYRIDVNGDGDRTTITTRSGEAEVSSSGSSLGVDAGHTLAFQGGDSPTYDLTEAIPQSGFEAWCLQRDQREEGSASVRYVGREMIGYEDLDDHGTWTEEPEYGPVWRPRVAVDWAPYRDGHWAWVGPWGWTWVDDAQWGFAPFHYGRWAHMRDGWGWVPGRVMARPVYAPALVVFVGGSGFSASMSFGGGRGVAWFPLGPREVYHPAYHVSNTYVQNLNSNHVTNINVINVTNVNVTNITYVNRTVVGAVTAVPQSAFVSSRSMASAAVPVSPGALRQAQVSGSTALVAPSRESVMARSGPGTIRRPPAQVVDRAVISRTPPPPPPVPFAARQQANAANPGKPLDRATLDRLQQKNPTAAPPVRSATAATTALRPAREGLPTPKPMVDRVNPQPAPRSTAPSPSPAPRPIPPGPPPRPAQERPNPDLPPRVEPVQNRPAQPVDRPVAKPIDRPAVPPAKHPIDGPVDRPIDRQVDRPVQPVRPADRPVNPPAAKPVARPADPPAKRPADRPVDRPVDRPASPARPVDRPASPARPADRPVDHPVPQPLPPARPVQKEKPAPPEVKRPQTADEKRANPKKVEDRPKKEEKPKGD